MPRIKYKLSDRVIKNKYSLFTDDTIEYLNNRINEIDDYDLESENYFYLKVSWYYVTLKDPELNKSFMNLIDSITFLVLGTELEKVKVSSSEIDKGVN